MCGRTCLTLEPEEIRCACKYKNLYIKDTSGNTNKNRGNNKTIENKEKNENIKDVNKNMEDSLKKNQSSIDVKDECEDEVETVTPEWRKEYNCGLEYKPCFNIAPQSITPVLVSSLHFDENNGDIEVANSRVIVPMLWGMIPFWHKGDYRKHGLTTNNCRLEHMLESKLYEMPFRRGQRCVVLCEGFYEWQTTKSSKPSERDAYMLYMPQVEGISIWNKETWSPENVKLLKLAGLFDVWTDNEGDKIFSYSVITFESNQTMSWLHHRMPAILETEQQVDDWLDFKRVGDKEALKILRPAMDLKWHRVSKIVNNSRNKQADCNKPFDIINASKKNGTNTLKSWLLARKRREQELNINYDSETDEESGENSSSSDNDSSNSRAKKPRFRDFKKLKQQKLNSTSADSGSV